MNLAELLSTLLLLAFAAFYVMPRLALHLGRQLWLHGEPGASAWRVFAPVRHLVVTAFLVAGALLIVQFVVVSLETAAELKRAASQNVTAPRTEAAQPAALPVPARPTRFSAR